MRRKWKKTFALMLALFLTVTSIENGALFVSAEETEGIESALITEEQESSHTQVPEVISKDTQEDTQEVTPEEMQEVTSEKTEEVISEDTQEVISKSEAAVCETTAEDTKADTQEVTTETADPMGELSRMCAESAEDVSMEDTESEEEEFAEKQILTYEPLEQPSNVHVTASAYEGVLPEGTYMIVSELPEGTNAYSEAEKTLEDHNISFDGFKAMDINFYNADGQAIEPEEGSVQVHMVLDAQMLPEGTDPNTIAVQHHDTSKGAVQIETVADVTVGNVAVQEAEVVAEFSVDSFSTFTITWNGIFNEYEVTVKYVDKTGKDINCTSAKNVEVNMGSTIALNRYAYEINGYTYQGAHMNAVNGETVTHVRVGWNGAHYYYQYSSDNKNWKNLKGKTTIYLVYDGSPAGGGSIVDTKTLSREKYVTKNADDTYDLTLTVSGAVGSLTNKVKMDVLLIVDKSNSMKTLMGSNKKRIEAVADAVKTLTTTLNTNKNLDVMYSVVTFSGPNDWETKGSNDDASTVLNWNSSAETAYNTVKNISPIGGTNYQAGINKGIAQLNSARSDAQKIVIFFTDGMPTVRNGYIACDETSPTDVGLCNDAAVTAVDGLSANAFYCIGTGSASKSNLTKIENAANATTKDVYLVSDTTDLNNAFKEIAADSAMILCDNVTVTDILSENVDVVMNGTAPKKLAVSIKKDNKDVVASAKSVVVPKTEQNGGNDASRTISTSYDAKTKQIRLNFPAEYKLEPDYTYMVTVTIDATEKAYENYRDYGNAYPDRGQLGTGVTSANQLGVFTNEQAQVNYTYKGENKSASYPMPVIQLHPGKLVIEKIINGLPEGVLPENLTFSYKLNNGNSVEVPFQSFLYNKETKSYTFAIEGLTPDTAYEVIESNAVVDGFELTQTTNGITGTVRKDGTSTASFTNTYTPSQCTLTVTKVVAGSMGYKNQAFAFELTVIKDGQSYTENIDGLTKENGVYVFTLKDGETKTILLPYGCNFTLSEKDDMQGYATTYVVDQGETVSSRTLTVSGLTEDTEVTFTNTRDLKAPTGIISNHTSFLMMIAVALTGVCLFLVVYRKRIRF